MKILFFCTAHNSLSQRLHLALSRSHQVTVEYALSDKAMITAVALAQPDLIICPFLTTLVPKAIYANVLTLIIHPGPPGDAGPSALDWVLMGDDGSVDDADQLLKKLDKEPCAPGRSWWGVTVLQAIEQFDAGPVWAFQKFPIDIDEPGLTKSELYRSSVSRAAIIACEAAVKRVQQAAAEALQPPISRVGLDGLGMRKYAADLNALPKYGLLSVSDNKPFMGGKLHHRPLLKAASRDFDCTRHTAQQVSRRIRCGDSQPGAMSKVFGPSLYIYGGIIDDSMYNVEPTSLPGLKAQVLGTRASAVCIQTSDRKGVWITHIRRPKGKTDSALWPKVPAVDGLIGMGILTAEMVARLHIAIPSDWSLSEHETFQEVWVDIEVDEHRNRTAFLFFSFYNGAMSVSQCSHLIEAMDYILAQSTVTRPIRAVVLMGGSYFSNGIALNVIEAAADPAQESWLNINRIDDVVQYLLQEFPSRNIMTVAAVRGNAAAGGVALATACDFVIAGSDVVLNPAYRAVGLYGSEYHTLSYYGRCSESRAKQLLRAMVPMSPLQARQIGLVDFIFPGAGDILDDHVKSHVTLMLKDGVSRRGGWKKNVDVSPAGLAKARAHELAEMSKDFWSARSTRYHSRRFDFVRKTKPTATPLRFARHRQLASTAPDEEETAAFEDVAHYQRLEQTAMVNLLRASVWSEVTTMLEDWEEDQQRGAGGDKRLRPISMPLPKGLLTPTTSTNVVLPLPLAPEKKSETLFGCYYQPLDSLLTPPESPMPGHNRFETRFGQL